MLRSPDQVKSLHGTSQTSGYHLKPSLPGQSCDRNAPAKESLSKHHHEPLHKPLHKYIGHSAAAYEAAKERLERKFGGKRRQIALNLEELENFKPLRPGFAKDLERLADLLDVTVVNLKEGGRHDELGNGSLYLSLCKKLTEAMLAQYHRWIYENGRWHSVETLREFIIQEAEFQTVESETIRGLSKRGNKKDNGLTFFGNTQKSSGNQRKVGFRPCKVCSGHHGVWRCEKFKAESSREMGSH